MLDTDLFGEAMRPKKRLQKPQTAPYKINLQRFPDPSPITYIGQNLYIRPNYIVSMPAFSKAKDYNTEARIKNQANLKDNKHKGKVSAKAMKEIKNCVNWLVASAKQKTLYHAESKKYYTFKVNFITLTLPDTYNEITDKILKEDLLNPLLTTLRKGYGLQNYIWKLEFQQNGKLHVHLTTDTFIYWQDLRRLWNKRLVSCGHMARFKAEHGHTDPNSTDVHAVYKINDIAAYISKYMSKDDTQLDKVKGRIWSCNQELAANSKPSIFIDRHSMDLSIFTLMQKAIKYKPIQVVTSALGTTKTIGDMFLLKRINWLMHIKGEVKELYNKTCWNIRNLVVPPEFNPVVEGNTLVI